MTPDDIRAEAVAVFIVLVWLTTGFLAALAAHHLGGWWAVAGFLGSTSAAIFGLGWLNRRPS